MPGYDFTIQRSHTDGGAEGQSITLVIQENMPGYVALRTPQPMSFRSFSLMAASEVTRYLEGEPSFPSATIEGTGVYGPPHKADGLLNFRAFTIEGQLVPPKKIDGDLHFPRLRSFGNMQFANDLEGEAYFPTLTMSGELSQLMELQGEPSFAAFTLNGVLLYPTKLSGEPSFPSFTLTGQSVYGPPHLLASDAAFAGLTVEGDLRHIPVIRGELSLPAFSVRGFLRNANAPVSTTPTVRINMRVGIGP